MTLWNLIRRGAACLIIAAACLAPSRPAAAQTPSTCLVASPQQLLERTQSVSLGTQQAPGILPAGATATITLSKPYAELQGLELRILMAPGSEPWPRDKPPEGTETPAVRLVAPADKPSETLVSFAIGSIGLVPWPSRRFLLLACEPNKPDPKFVLQFFSHVSSRELSIIAALSASIIFYLIMVATMSRAHRNDPAWPSPWNPIMFAASDTGASLSRLQTLFFSFIVAGLLTYILMRAGLLSDLSMDVLKLLGIAAAGSAVGQATDVGRKRLSLKNWSWLTEKNWLPPADQQKPKAPEWRDLLTSDNEFNVYRFQMLIFSLIVGASLISVGFSELATYKIPDALLGVLGLSQVVYVVGKAVSPPTIGELDAALDELQKQETVFITTVAEKWRAPGSIQPPAGATPAQQLAVAKVAAQTEYNTFRDNADKVYRIFAATIGQANAGAVLPPNPNLEPDLPR